MKTSHRAAVFVMVVVVMCSPLGYCQDVDVPARIEARLPIHLPNSHLSTSDVLVMVVASQKRDDWKLQADTWLKHFPYYIVTEEHTPNCKLCGTPHSTPYKGGLFDKPVYLGDRFHGKPVDWYCAQQRPLQALQTVLHLNLASLPKWLFIIDDDTLVHPWNLLRMLTDPPANHEALQLYGSERRGGAGFILSQGALKNLTSHIQISDMSWDQGALTWRQEPGQTTLLDACLSRLLGGNWCYMHSDHVMGLCARSAGIHIVDRNTTMAQWCPVGTTLMNPKALTGLPNPLRDAAQASPKTQAWLLNAMVSCHYMDHTAMHSIYNHIRGTWEPAAPRQGQPRRLSAVRE